MTALPALSEPPAALSVENVFLSYAGRTVIDGLSFSIAPGESFGLIGLNGVGKTTLIKAVLGLRDCEQGIIRFSGRADPAGARRAAYVPELFDPPWFLSGLEFLRFAASLYGAVPDEASIFSASERLALDPAVLKNRVRTYSKGMRQKLGLLSAVLTACPLLVLDEPMSGLDPRARALVKEMIHEVRAAGRTILLSTHILADMAELCDRVGVLHAGRLIFTGTPAALLTSGGTETIERAFLSVIAGDGKNLSCDK